MKNRAVFLDRDGVINVDKDYVYKIKDLEFIPGSIEALKKLQANGFKLIIITNQSGIGRGHYTLKDYKRFRKHFHKELRKNNIKITAEYFCPHAPERNCDCRKPKTKLIEKAVKKFKIDVKRSYFIGDKTSDILAGKRAKLKTILVKTGKAGKDGKFKVEAGKVCKSLREASEIPIRKVLMIGSYNIEGYSRGRILYDGLIKNKIKTDLFLHHNYFSLIKRLFKKDFDVILVSGKFNLLVTWILKIIHKKKIIFDLFISDYDNLVNDRKLVKKKSLKAKIVWLGDKYSCVIADKIILDTNEHIKYFIKEFKLNKKKFKTIYIGADEKIFYPINIKKPKKFIVSFHGTFIPLQGIEYIVKAAKILEKDEVFFEIIGKGQTYEEIIELTKKLKVNNISFLGFKKINILPKYLSKADICLGIFGKTEKTLKVIPNKAYEIIAMKKPLITSNTRAIRELFTDEKNCLLCEVANEKSLARRILDIKKNKKLRDKIGKEGYLLFKEKCSSEKIGKELKKII